MQDENSKTLQQMGIFQPSRLLPPTLAPRVSQQRGIFEVHPTPGLKTERGRPLGGDG